MAWVTHFIEPLIWPFSCCSLKVEGGEKIPKLVHTGAQVIDGDIMTSPHHHLLYPHLWSLLTLGVSLLGGRHYRYATAREIWLAVPPSRGHCELVTDFVIKIYMYVFMVRHVTNLSALWICSVFRKWVDSARSLGEDWTNVEQPKITPFIIFMMLKIRSTHSYMI